jgi:hypothetical protein
MAIKSAYELALERTGGDSGPKLTDKQKSKLAELEQLYKAKIAEQELALKPKIDAARVSANAEEADKLETQLRHEIAKLKDKLETEKDKIRQG